MVRGGWWRSASPFGLPVLDPTGVAVLTHLVAGMMMISTDLR